jgi:hypothetical protein
LKSGWSPWQIKGRLKSENAGQCIISHETIYRYIYSNYSIRNMFYPKLRRASMFGALNVMLESRAYLKSYLLLIDLVSLTREKNLAIGRETLKSGLIYPS